MIDLENIPPHEFKIHKERPVQAGRVLGIDGDFIAYFISGSKEVSKEDMPKQAASIIETLRKAAGAEKVLVHMTPHGSTKGGRFEIARLKPYQATRSKSKPELLEYAREIIAADFPSYMYHDLEADDGMCSYQYACNAASPCSSILVSRDKDIRMIPGLHLDWDTHEILVVPFAGHLEIKYTPAGTKKLCGSGFKFFCAQMLMGDPADNISGLPGVVLETGVKKCGPVMAHTILDTADTPLECIKRVAAQYSRYGKEVGFTGYSGEKMTAKEAFESEAKLLWLRRFNDENDVLDVIKEICSGG